MLVLWQNGTRNKHDVTWQKTYPIHLSYEWLRDRPCKFCFVVWIKQRGFDTQKHRPVNWAVDHGKNCKNHHSPSRGPWYFPSKRTNQGGCLHMPSLSLFFGKSPGVVCLPSLSLSFGKSPGVVSVLVLPGGCHRFPFPLPSLWEGPGDSHLPPTVFFLKGEVLSIWYRLIN